MCASWNDIDPNSMFTDLKYITSDRNADSTTYLGKIKISDKPVCIKKMLIVPRYADLIAQEISFHQMCTCPNVSELYSLHMERSRNKDASASAGTIWIASECLDLGALDDILLDFPANVENPITAADCAYCLREVLKALVYTHTMRIAFRKCLSGHVMVSSSGLVKICHFQDVVPLGDKRGEVKIRSHRGSELSIPYWMPPEEMRGPEDCYSEGGNIWRVGFLLRRMVEEFPYYDLPILKAIFFISTKGMPLLKDQAKWPQSMHDCLALTFKMDAKERPSAKAMLQHEFLRMACTAEEFGKKMSTMWSAGKQ